jgi:hypothetical protein
VTDEQYEAVASALVGESAVEMVTEDGGMVEVWTISHQGALVTASAPRLLVREGMRLRCRLRLDANSYRIAALIITATIQSHTRASLTLRIDEATIDRMQRASQRFQLAQTGSITALVCDRVVPGEQINVALHDISQGGVALQAADLRPRPNDRYRLQLRFFEGPIDCEIRVLSIRPTNQPGTQTLGCTLLAPTPQTERTLHRILSRLQTITPMREPQTPSAASPSTPNHLRPDASTNPPLPGNAPTRPSPATHNPTNSFPPSA